MSQLILDRAPLGLPWVTVDPFLFCVHHKDAYPAGNDRQGPAVSLAGRNLGNDFEIKDGFRMYHGQVVPGFPQHPHRGFETVTIVREGFVDHSDSLGATARFGAGDVQWLTAGAGIVHCEMFPLRKPSGPNPLELFQIWLNLPAKDKLAPPHFSMLWSDTVPRIATDGASRERCEITLIAGKLDGARPPPPPPSSWASDAHNDVAIWTIRLGAGGRCVLPPPTNARAVRTLYFYSGARLQVGGEELKRGCALVVHSEMEVPLRASDDACELLMLQGAPIGEPVAQHGPFVMNSRAEIQQAFMDYHRTGFGGWPWPSDDPVHPREAGRFAKHVGGRLERP